MRLLLAILLLLPAVPFCQNLPLYFHHLNVEDGLSQNSVLCTVQDHRGFLWLGTRNGLNKYDAQRLTVYKNRPDAANSLSGDYILSLLSDKKQHLWIGTRHGLNRYRPEKDDFERINVHDSLHPQAGSGVINCLFEDSKGRLWVGTSQALFLCTDTDQLSFTAFTAAEGFPARGVLSIFEDRDGMVWAGTYAGLASIGLRQDGMMITVYQHDATKATSLSEDQVTSIVQDKEGMLWVGTVNNGLNRFDLTTHQFERYKHADKVANSLVNDHVRKLLYEPASDRLWIGTQEGLSVLALGSHTFSAYTNDPWNKNSLSQNSIHSLYKDHSGTIWIGTFFGGVNYHSPYGTAFRVYNNRSASYRLNNNVVSAMAEEDSRYLWVGTEGGGLNRIDRSTGSVQYFVHKPSDMNSLGSNLVKTMYKDKEGHIWTGTHGGGLNLFNPATQQFTRYLYKRNDASTQGSEITALLEDQQGRFWVGKEIQGVQLFHRDGTTLLPYPAGKSIEQSIGRKAILCLLEDAHRTVWAGTSSGLYRISGDHVQLLEENTGYPFYVNCLMQDVQGNIWAGTLHHGIVVYNAQGRTIASYTRQQGLPDNNVPGLLQDAALQDIWISTGNGLARLSWKDRQITRYTEADGLAGNVFNNSSYFKSSSGELFVGGFNGLTAFFPAQIHRNTEVAPTRITGLKLFNQPVVIGGEDKVLQQDISFTRHLTLQHHQNVFAFDFAILSFIKPNKHQYAYQLRGFDKDWNYTSMASASYTNVPPGDYTFTVKGANNDGTWSAPVELAVSVLPPFWRTWWAWCIYVLLAATLVFFIIRFFFLRALLKRNQELTQLKLNFFTNISHEIRTHLSLIIGPAEKLLQQAGPQDAAQPSLRTIKANSESLLQLMNELMDFRRAETGHLSLRIGARNIVPFAQSVFESFHDLAIARHIDASFVAGTQDLELWFDNKQLEKVLYNLLSNAFKFTPDGGKVSMQVQDMPTQVAIHVTDNGRGISPENIHKLFDNYFQEDDHGKQNTGYGIGLALSKSIVDMHKGTLTVSSRVNNHDEHLTTFTITLRKGNTHLSPAQLVADTAPSVLPTATPVAEQDAVVTAATITDDGVLTNTAAVVRNTILLVEDNISIRAFIRDALQTQYDILESNNGLEGLASATTVIPDLIISDVMMPEMDGMAFCQRIKTDARTSHIPVILLTAKTDVTHQITGLQNGADIYLTKPFSIQVLELQIRNLLASRARLWESFRQQYQTIGPVPETTLPALDATAVTAAAPDLPPPALHPLDAAFMDNLIRMVDEHMEEMDFGVAQLSKMAAMSQPVLYKKINAITGMTANDFVKSLRLKKAALLLQENRYTVYEIAAMVGYENSKYFSREFKKQFGHTPTDYAKQ